MKKYIHQCLWALAVLWKLKTITRVNRLRLLRKTINLFVCFLSFTDKERPQSQLRGAMICAILSALYDYETDWVPIQGSDSLYRELLYETVANTSARKIAWNLFEADLHNRLTKHGLERGSDALVFYRIVIGSTWLSKYSAEEIAGYGRKLQIVDDLLDLEEDRTNGHTNCLLTPEREEYLREVEEFFESEFYKALADNSLIYHQLRSKLSNHRVEEKPTTWQLIASCRLHTGVFAFVLTIIGFKILQLSLASAIPIAIAFLGITSSIHVFNDLMDRERDVQKGKTLAHSHPLHIFRTWKWVSVVTMIVLIMTMVFWWKLALFIFVVWIFGLVYSIEKIPYPFNNLLVAFCAGSPALIGMIQTGRLDMRMLSLFFIVFTTIFATEMIKDMQDRVGDIGYKDTLATKVAWPVVAMQAVTLCYLPVVGVMFYPGELVRSLGYVFGIVVFFLGLSFTREKALLKAKRVGYAFLATLLIVLLCTQ